MFLLDWIREQNILDDKASYNRQNMELDIIQRKDMVKLAIKEKELDLANKAQSLRLRLVTDRIGAERMLLELNKEKDQLERAKAEFRILIEKQSHDLDFDVRNKELDLQYKKSNNDIDIMKRLDELEMTKVEFYARLNTQKKELELRREQMRNEHSLENKKVDNDFYVQKQNIFLKSQEIETQYQLEKERLSIQREEVMNKRIEIEAMKAEKQLQTLIATSAQIREEGHIEKMKKLELIQKEFELQLACIKLYSADKQAQEFQNLQQDIQSRMNNLFNGDGSIYGKY